MTTKLTDAQRSVLCRELINPGEGVPFILLATTGDDKVAKALEKKGLGHFTDHKNLYTWRRRDGYHNLFTPNDEGHALRAQLIER